MKRLLLVLLIVYNWTSALCQSQIEGQTKAASDNQPLPGVNVVVKGTTIGTTTDSDGRFSIMASEKDILVFSFIGYKPQEVVAGSQTQIDIVLQEDIATLDEVTIVSTGYEKLPKERATGSFVQVDNELVNRRVSPDILSRLEDVTSGLIFNRNVQGTGDISIRGRSTISGNAQPLIVIDNFPYDGDIANINPNDVESITVLKDAAAASIWGARAGNGVIVITTKKGKTDQPLQVSLNTNVTISQQPDLFYEPRMTTSDYIDLEKTLFANGFYENAEASSNYAPITPAVELMIANRDGTLSDGQLETELNSLRQQDVRRDFERYIFRKSTAQQYAINLRGGSPQTEYFLSAGFDKSLQNLVGNENSRVTINAGNTWHLLKDKIDLNTGVYYVDSRSTINNSGTNDISFNSDGWIYPYARLKDAAGNNTSITKDYRLAYAQGAESNGLLNWLYNPIEEIDNNDNTSRVKDIRVNASLKYNLTKDLNVEALYQYWNAGSSARNYRSTDTYYTRNLINLLTQDDGTGTLTRVIPDGGILDRFEQDATGNSLRAQVNYSKKWRVHELSSLAGYEVREVQTDNNSWRYYGYDDNLGTQKIVDYINYYPAYNNPGNFLAVPNGDGIGSLTDRFISYYGNAAYTYNRKYTLSASGRKDQSNLFGVNANQRGVPLWSVGVAWNATDESFMKFSFLPYLKVRSTIGFNGNIDKSVTAYTTALSRGANRLTGLPYATILNPPNSSLQWERVKIWNTGIDFELKDKVLTGSVEFYKKWGLDLIGTKPFPPSTGVTSYRGNYASTRGYGWDLVLTSTNVNKALLWQTTLLFSTIREKVTEHEVKAVAAQYVRSARDRFLVYPMEGKPLYSVYSYNWAGLDPETGDPRGFLEGKPSNDYATIIETATPENIIYHGSARPTAFGSLRNTLTWKNISLSFNISYRLGYYIKMNSVRYSAALSGVPTHGDYSHRWQNPGDESNTYVPSMPSEINFNREDFYLNSSVLVEKGDHIRLQDINLSYSFAPALLQRLSLKNLQLYLYANNLGIIWKATDKNVDPDYETFKPLRTMACGLRLTF